MYVEVIKHILCDFAGIVKIEASTRFQFKGGIRSMS